MSIITVSRELGSGGTDVAARLRERLKAHFLDREIVEAGMQKHNIPTDRLEKLDERRPGLLAGLSVHADRYRHFLRLAVFDLAAKGNCVILGRGAHAVLAGVPGVLRVRIVASRDARIWRLQRRFDCTEEAAARMIKLSDRDRAGFLSFHFDLDWDDPRNYDMVLNTRSLSINSVTELVLEGLSRRQMEADRDTTQRILADRCLEHHVRTELIFHSCAPVYSLDVMACNGVVTLRGETTSPTQVEKSAEMTAAVPGVVQVQNEILYMPRTPARPL